MRGSLYSNLYSHATDKAISAILIGLFVVLLMLGLYLFFLRKEVPLFGLFLLMLASAVALPILQHTALRGRPALRFPCADTTFGPLLEKNGGPDATRYNCYGA